MKLLEGKQELLVGIADEQSIAADCARAFRDAGTVTIRVTVCETRPENRRRLLDCATGTVTR